MKHSVLILAFIFCLIPYTNVSQTFEFAKASPFGIQMVNGEDSSRLALKYFFTDQDDDGDLDLILFGLGEQDTLAPTIISSLRYFFEFQENIGDKYNPQFGPREKLYEDFDFPGGFGFALPSIGELTNDQKFDILMAVEVDGDYLQHPLIYFQNSDYTFEKNRCETWDLDPLSPNSFFFPELVDLDMDGDQDLLLSGYYGENYEGEGNTNAILYAKNIGTPNNPDFLGWFENPYGLEADSIPKLFRGGDLDLDGDMDLLALSLSGDEEVNFYYYKNEPGPDGKPHFSEPVALPVGFPVSQHKGDNYIFPNIVDIDGDRDLDIFFYHQEETDDTTIVTLDLYENKLCTSNEFIIEQTICEGESFEGYTVTGTYTDMLTAANGCDSLRILELEVLTNPETTVTQTICQGESFEGYTESGTYEDMFPTASGCDSTRVLNLTVQAISETSIVLDLCEGESINIGGQEITTSDLYTFYLISQNGCDSIVHADISFHTIDNSIFVNGNILSSGAGGSTVEFQWFDCDSGTDIPGANSAIFEPLVSGSYAVRLRDEYGCTADSECVLITLTGVDEPDVSKNLRLFPNPANNFIYIYNESGYKINQIQMYDRNGRLLKTESSSDILDLTFLPAGIYLVSLKLEGIRTSVVRKISVLR